jgi:hypothetical protein
MCSSIKVKKISTTTKKYWTSTISFWLKLDPANELEPGYTDPLQITDVNYNDAAIWVDFTDKNPRNFRLGLIGDLAPRKADSTFNEQEYHKRRLVRAITLPFTSDKWTHILIKVEKLNTGSGQASLYLNAILQETKMGISDDFTWDITQSNIFLGINYIGMMDELTILNKALSDKEIVALYQMKAGLKKIL